MLFLTVSQRLALKRRAHTLKPVVMIGNAGLTPAVLDEIERSLKSHDLLKIKVMHDEREARETMLQAICTQLKAAAVQHIGKVLIIYRPLETPITKLPKQRNRKKPLTKKQLAARSQ